jgi:hypothetical protein
MRTNLLGRETILTEARALTQNPFTVTKTRPQRMR